MMPNSNTGNRLASRQKHQPCRLGKGPADQIPAVAKGAVVWRFAARWRRRKSAGGLVVRRVRCSDEPKAGLAFFVWRVFINGS